MKESLNGLPLISIVIPAYNESECVDELARRLTEVFARENSYNWECIIVENGSQDDTWEKLRAIHAADPRFKILRLARNFRMDGGLTAGLAHAKGDACVFMTADLQDPPEMIPVFLREWENGFENVYAIVTKRHGTGPLRTLNSKAFYWLAGKMSDNRIPKNASDFRLMDRRVYEAVRSMEERNRFVRGLVAWVGFKSVGIPMERPERFGGQSNAHSLGVLELALKGIFAHSFLPLRLISITGVIMALLSVVGLVISVVLWFTQGVPFGGFGTLVSLILLLFGTLVFMIGILSEYVGLIYEEVKQRPNFVVSETLGSFSPR
jgi:glycosyltransferase involved in cell wall biosynthesis